MEVRRDRALPSGSDNELKKIRREAAILGKLRNEHTSYVLTLGNLVDIMYPHRYQICGTELDHVFEEKEGVTIDFELIFEQHITQKMNKANAMMCIIRRNFSFLDRKLFKKLCITWSVHVLNIWYGYRTSPSM